MGRHLSRKEVVELLKMERGMVREGGYGASVRTPRATPTHFRDSAICLNYGRKEDETLDACDYCFLMDFVPEKDRQRPLPCHHIPLNEKGETLAALAATGDRERLEEALDEWLQTMSEKLEKEPQA